MSDEEISDKIMSDDDIKKTIYSKDLNKYYRDLKRDEGTVERWNEIHYDVTKIYAAHQRLFGERIIDNYDRLISVVNYLFDKERGDV